MKIRIYRVFQNCTHLLHSNFSGIWFDTSEYEKSEWPTLIEILWPTQTPPTCSPTLRWEPTFRGSAAASSAHPDQIRYWRSPDIKLFRKLWQYWEIFDNEEFIFVEALSLAFPRIISQVDDKRRALIQLTLQLIRYTYKWDSRCQFLLELGVTASVWCRKSWPTWPKGWLCS